MHSTVTPGEVFGLIAGGCILFLFVPTDTSSPNHPGADKAFAILLAAGFGCAAYLADFQGWHAFLALLAGAGLVGLLVGIVFILPAWLVLIVFAIPGAVCGWLLVASESPGSNHEWRWIAATIGALLVGLPFFFLKRHGLETLK